MAKLELALTVDETPAWFGYGKGVGHMIMSSVVRPGGDHIGGNADTVPVVCVEGKSLETGRLVEKFTGDARCKRCQKWAESLGCVEAVESARVAAVGAESGPTVADMILADPDAVLITLGSGTIMPDADVVAPDAWQAQQDRKADKVLAEGKRAAKDKRAAKRAKADAEPSPVRCVNGRTPAPGTSDGGEGQCPACSTLVALRQDGKTTAHWVGNRAPKSVGLSERKVGPEAPLAESPATIDTGNKSADDMLGGNAAGALPGRTSLTRGRPMDADKVTGPRERREGGKPVSTTMDAPLGGERIDARSAEIEIAGGRYGYLTPEEVGGLSATQRRRYWRHVSRNNDRAVRARQLVALRQADTRTRAERMAGKRLASV